MAVPRRRKSQSGQALVEYALVYSLVILPVTFAMIFTSLLLWVWHSANDFTREGARYAVTHCWQNGGQNVIGYMRSHSPITWDRDQFQNGPMEIQVLYFAKDPESGDLVEFTCDGECTAACVPDIVTVKVTNYEFRGMQNYFGLAPLRMPDFQTTLPMESAGCDPEQGTCVP